MRKKTIEKRLREALLRNGKMEYGLYEYELEEHINTWHEELKADKEDFVFVVTESSEAVAMVLVTADNKVYVNEQAREKLLEYWPETYEANLNKLIPMMVSELSEGMLSVTGVQTVTQN